MPRKRQQAPLRTPSSETLQIRELDQANKIVTTYVTYSTEDGQRRITFKAIKNADTYARSFLNAFLPVGYPNSVTKDYLQYQIYDSLQAFSSSIAGMLSSRAVLEGIGVGDSHASPTAALLLSVLQESMGRIATILFAHRLGTALEPECKMYRLAADVFNDAAMVLDCLSPALPKTYRVMLLSLSSVLRALCGVAAGSSKASLSAHFATQGNLGELNAKDSSQETIISLLGMLAGSLVVSFVSSKWATWTAMILLLAIHLGTNYMAVRAVCMRTLNRQRANIVFAPLISSTVSHFISWLDSESDSQITSESTILTARAPLTPEEVCVQERVFERDNVLRGEMGEILGYCTLGVTLDKLLRLALPGPHHKQNSTTAPAYTLTPTLESTLDGKYIIWKDAPSKTFLVVLRATSTRVHLKAWFHALLLANFEFYHSKNIKGSLEVLKMSYTYVEEVWPQVEESLYAAGWNTDVDAMLTRPCTHIQNLNNEEGENRKEK